MQIGGQSEVATVRSLLLKHPRDAFISQAHIEAQWRQLGFTAPPDFQRALDEYARLTEILRQTIPDIYFLPPAEGTTLDSVYVHDPILITTRGIILTRMGKPDRRAEPAAAAAYLELELGLPVLGTITGDGMLEGGDVVWFDENTLAVGQGYRTNASGIAQMKELLGDTVREFITVPLPHWTGPEEVLHLMSLISPLAPDIALVFSRLLPVPFREWLLERGIRLVEVCEDEYDSMAGNVLALSPGHCLMLEGNPVTRRRMEQAGVHVQEFQGREICHKGCGGPTCLTRPILRQND
jgi:N-dimethylarginine dimethylaminohydrolase